MWETHNTHLVNFDVTALRVIWLCSGALWGSSERLHQQLYGQIREELESGSFGSSASRVAFLASSRCTYRD